MIVRDRKLYWEDGTPNFLVHADSPESRLKPGNEAAFLNECRLLPTYGVNTITVTGRGDDLTTIYPWLENNPTKGVDTGKMNIWKNQLQTFISECELESLKGTIIFYLGERTNWDSITQAQYFDWIDALGVAFQPIAKHMIFGWEEIGQNVSMQAVANFVNPIAARIKEKLPGSLVMIHNNPGQKPWTVTQNVDLMCIQETTAANMHLSAAAAYNSGYAVHLHEWYNGFRVGSQRAVNLDQLDLFLQQAKGITSGYGVFAADYDSAAPDPSKLAYLYQALSTKLSGGVIPQPTMPTITSLTFERSPLNVDLLNATDFTVTESPNKVTVRADGDTTTKSVKFELTGPVNKVQTESQKPWCLFGDSAGVPTTVAFPVGTYTLKVTPYSAGGATGTAGTSVTRTITITGATVPPPPTTKPEVVVDVTADPAEVTLVIKVNGVVQ